MKKKISVILFGLILSFTSLIKLNAASASISVSVNKSSLVVGNTVNATVTIYSSGGIGSWEYTINYDTSKLKLISGEVSVADVAASSGVTSKSYNYTFKAISSGSASIGVKSYSVVNWDVEEIPTSQSSRTVNIITEQELVASYSKNNNLSSISVEGYDLDKTFDKDTLEYTVTVPSDTLKINLSATLDDTKASLSGIGEFDVSEGDNKFDIIVTAENGNTKTYSVIVKVEDTNPITTIINNKKYTVVKRKSNLTIPNTYEETTILIEDIEIPAFVSNITNFTLVGLKDESGNISLFLYDKENNKYSIYKEIKTTGIVIYPMEPKSIPSGYKKVTISINDMEVVAYKSTSDEFYLLYGTNIENNKTDFYEYDKVNNTMSRYNGSEIEELTKRNENYMIIILVLGVETIVLVMILLITMINNKRRKKRIMKKRKESIKKESEVNEKEN